MMLPWLIALAIGLPWLGALAVWGATDHSPRAQHAIAVLFSAAAGAAALALIPYASAAVAFSIPVGGSFGALTFVVDGLGLFLAIVATVVGSLSVLFSVEYMRGEPQLGRYYALVLTFIGAMVGLALTGSLFYLFFFWEITALCSWALISFHNDDPRAVAGGIKALVITQVGGVGLLAGALVAQTYTGSAQISTLLSAAPALPATTLALLAYGFLVAAAAKSAQVPFHSWLPDAMEAPTPVSALIHAATMVNAGVYLLARFYPAFADVPGWTTAVVVVGALSALLAAIMALVASDLKRVLAYSTISQLGYMVYAVGTGALFASQFHLLSHALFKALLFLGAGAIIHALGTRDMRQMGALWSRMPVTRNTFVIGAMALAGLPLLNGFWSKELVLEEGLANGPLWGYVVMLLVAGLTALYSARMVWMVFLGERATARDEQDAPGAMRVSLGLLAAGTVLSGLLAGHFGALLARTLPYHEIHTASTVTMMRDIALAPATVLALAVTGLGLLAWHERQRLDRWTAALDGVTRAARDGFGFDRLNGQIVALTGRAATLARATQTGQLNWNLLGLVGGLLLLLAFLGGAGR